MLLERMDKNMVEYQATTYDQIEAEKKNQKINDNWIYHDSLEILFWILHGEGNIQLLRDSKPTNFLMYLFRVFCNHIYLAGYLLYRTTRGRAGLC